MTDVDRRTPGREGAGDLSRAQARAACARGLALLALALAAPAAALAQSTPVPTTVTLIQRNAVHQLRPCLVYLSTADRRLIATQFGIGGKPIPTIAAVAAQLNETPAAEYAQVVYSLRRMEANARRGLCRMDAALPGATSAAARAPATSATPTGSTPRGASAVVPVIAGTHASSSSSWEIPGAAVLLAALAATSLMLSRRRRPARAGGPTAGSVAAGDLGRSAPAPAARITRRPAPRLTREGLFVREVPRKRRYVGRTGLALARPLFRHSLTRDAYVLRGVGNRVGPVLREDRRRHNVAIEGPDRRRAGAA